MRFGVVLVFLVGCIDSGAVLCDDGRTCPADKACDLIHHGCVNQDQLMSCGALADGDPCTILATNDGICDHDGTLGDIEITAAPYGIEELGA